MKLTILTVNQQRKATLMMRQFAGVEYGRPYSVMPTNVASDNAVLWGIVRRAAIASSQSEEFNWVEEIEAVNGSCKTSRKLAFLLKRAELEYSVQNLRYAYTVRREMAKREEWVPYGTAETGVLDYARVNEAIACSRAKAMAVRYRLPNFQRRDCFSVELEFVCKADSVMSGDEFRYENVQNSDVTFVGDGSVSPTGENQRRARYQEVRVSCAWSKVGKLYNTCAALKEGGAIVNRSCGLHVHLDSRHLTAQQEATRRRKLVAALPWLVQLVPESRRMNSFCILNGQRMHGRDRRYQAINPLSYRKHQTTEIRLGSGSLDPDKILNWATVLKLVADNRGFIRTFDSFLLSAAPQHIKVWAVLRRDKFSPSVGTSQELSEV